MNTGFVMCGSLCLLYLLLALPFAVFKGKAAMLISGFNAMPKSKRELYDTEKMSRDCQNTLLLLALIQGAGAVLSCCISQYAAVAAFVTGLVLFLKDVHLDEEKAFGKYKK